jgi:hypothetical protein
LFYLIEEPEFSIASVNKFSNAQNISYFSAIQRPI